MTDLELPEGVEITGAVSAAFAEVLTPTALSLIARLHRVLDDRRRALLTARADVVASIDAGGTLGFLPETESVRRDTTWRVAEPAPGLIDRRVEITGPTDRKMTINALNSGARVWLADQEDANTPHWENVIGGQINLRDAIRREIDFTSPEGKTYRLEPAEQLATIVVRPRGLHLPEKHIRVDGHDTSGALVDFALYLATSGQLQIDRGHGPYFYLPKLEHHLEARLWNDAFLIGQDQLGIRRGTIRATVLIETYPAAFQMEEILYELREHSAGLNAGRWDYIFSVIKTFRNRGKEMLLPDRHEVTMTVPFMRAYTDLLVRTCHKRGAHAIGGMAAFIPSRDEAINRAAFEKVKEDKEREANAGFDGSWVAHPGMVQTCEAAFGQVLGDRPDQRDVLREDVAVTPADLLAVSDTPGRTTENGLRTNIAVGIEYLAMWIMGRGAVGINNLMEDAATAEISRSQTWQWLHNDVELDTGEVVTSELVRGLVDEEYAKLDTTSNPAAYERARDLFLDVAVADEFVDFLTLPAYRDLP